MTTKTRVILPYSPVWGVARNRRTKKISYRLIFKKDTADV